MLISRGLDLLSFQNSRHACQFFRQVAWTWIVLLILVNAEWSNDKLKSRYLANPVCTVHKLGPCTKRMLKDEQAAGGQHICYQTNMSVINAMQTALHAMK